MVIGWLSLYLHEQTAFGRLQLKIVHLWCISTYTLHDETAKKWNHEPSPIIISNLVKK